MANKKAYWIGIIILIVFAGFLMISKDDSSESQSSQATNALENHQVHMAIISEEQFIFEMASHHQEAVDASNTILAKSDNEDLKDLAQDIVNAQTEEIEMLNSWKTELYPHSTYQSLYTPMMPNLENLEGEELDKAFLQGMIAHHEMAITMAEQVMALNPKPDIELFAANIVKVQSAEIEKMRKMLN